MRCRYVSVTNFTISIHLNNFPQPICINDFQIIRVEVILELCPPTMEDASVEVKPNIFLAKAWKFPAIQEFFFSFSKRKEKFGRKKKG